MLCLPCIPPRSHPWAEPGVARRLTSVREYASVFSQASLRVELASARVHPLERRSCPPYDAATVAEVSPGSRAGFLEGLRLEANYT